MKPQKNRFIAITAVSVALAIPAFAADGTWNVAGNGSWTTAANWVSNTIAGGAGFTADFTGFSGNITLDGNRTLEKLIFSDPTWYVSRDLSSGSGGSLTLAGATPTITVNAMGFQSKVTISSAILGTQGLTKDGVGTLVLSGGVANTLTGAINVNAGLLGIQDSASLTNVAGAITVASGASFDAKAAFGASIANNFTLSGTGSGINNYGALNIRENANLTGAITLAGNTLITHDWNIAYINGSITGTNTNLELQTLQPSQGGFQITAPISLGTGALTLTGIGTSYNADFELTGSNSYTGGTLLKGGRVSINNSSALGNGTVTFVSNTSLTGTANLTHANAITVNSGVAATLGADASTTLVQSGAVTGTGSLIKSGNGTVTLSGGVANTFNGPITVNAGMLGIQDSASLTNVAGAITVASGATFDAKAFYGAAITNNFTLSGNGSGINNYGALNIRENANLTGAITLAADTRITHDWNIAFVNASITGTNTNLELQTLQPSQYGFYLNGAISLGTGALTLTGIGTSGSPDFTLSGNNTFTGGVVINNGVVKLNSVGALNSTAGSENAVTFGASTTGKLALNGRSYVIANLASNATPGTPVVENGNATAVTLTVGNSQNLSGTYAGVIRDGTGGGALSLTKSGTGTFTLRDGANSYTGGTTVNQGTLALGTDYGNNQNSNALGSGAVTVTGGAQLRLGGVGGGVVDFTVGNAITLDNGTIFGNDGVQHLTGGLTVAAGGGSLFVNWGGKNISLEGAVAGSGTLAINNQAGQGNGAVVFATGGTIGGLTGSGFAKVSSGQTLAVGSNGANTTFSGTLDGAGAITKTGTGTLTLTGTNYYSGSTTISGGTLKLDATGTINNTSEVSLGTVGTFDVTAKGLSGYTVGTLKGSGNVTGALTVSTQLAIGNSPGTTNFSSSLTLGSASTYLYELTSGASPGLNSADLGDIAGALTIDTGSILDLVQLGAYTVGNKFTLFAYDGLLTGTFKDTSSNALSDGATFTDAGGIWMIDYNDTIAGANGGVSASNTFVTITAIPEPNAAALLGGLGMFALLRRRR